MSRHSVRLAALAGAAAVALGIATPAVAAAVEHTATVHSVAATATPISHAGRVVTVTMPTTHYAATAAHSDAVVNLAVAGPSTVPANSSTNVVPANVQNVNASGGTIAAGTVATMLLAVIVGFGVKGGRVRIGWAVACAVLGVFLGGTIFGALSEQLGGTVVSSLNNILSSI